MKKNWYTVAQVHTNIYALAEFSHWELVVSYLVVDTNNAFLIDTGMGYASMKKEIEKITRLPIRVLLTHTHWDHIGSMNEFERVYVFDHPFELASAQKGFHAKDIAELSNIGMFSDGYTPKKFSVKGKKLHRKLHDGQSISSDNFDIKVLHTPGHTPGSVCFYIPQFHALFTGDTLYPGPLYAQLPESNPQDYVHSIDKLKKFGNEKLLILPGHNAVTAKNNLLQEASKLFHRLDHSTKAAHKKEVKGKSLSIKLH